MFSQKELMDIQWDLVIPNFKDPKTIAFVRGKVEDASFGSSSHRAGVLNVALKKALEFKRKNRQPPSVLLRCPTTYCTGYNNPFLYATVGSKLYCQWCRNSVPPQKCYLQCAGCGASRTGAYESCQSCRGKFV